MTGRAQTRYEESPDLQLLQEMLLAESAPTEEQQVLAAERTPRECCGPSALIPAILRRASLQRQAPWILSAAAFICRSSSRNASSLPECPPGFFFTTRSSSCSCSCPCSCLCVSEDPPRLRALLAPALVAVPVFSLFIEAEDEEGGHGPHRVAL